MTVFVVNVAKEILCEDKISMMKPLMGSEDFSFYLQKIPGTFVFLGVGNKEKGIIYPQHHPKYNIDEDILPIGTALYVAVALEYLRGRQVKKQIEGDVSQNGPPSSRWISVSKFHCPSLKGV
jgi:metal-dependent amidase/aminoacylase/carboxypeptidase family protein